MYNFYIYKKIKYFKRYFVRKTYKRSSKKLNYEIFCT